VVDPALAQQQQNTWLEYRVRTECQGTKIYRKHSSAGGDRVNCSLRHEGDSHGVSGLDQDRRVRAQSSGWKSRPVEDNPDASRSGPAYQTTRKHRAWCGPGLVSCRRRGKRIPGIKATGVRLHACSRSCIHRLSPLLAPDLEPRPKSQARGVRGNADAAGALLNCLLTQGRCDNQTFAPANSLKFQS